MEENELVIMSDEEIKKLIYTIRGKQVMLGGDIEILFIFGFKLEHQITEVIESI